MKRGDIVHLGRHRLMCGDCTEKGDVARLFEDDKPHLVFTSPPYLKQRNYGNETTCWTTMMTKSLRNMPMHAQTQIIVNLGLIHRNGEWLEYWQEWLANMRMSGWRRFGWYVWDKLESLPGNRNGRLAPSFEFIFHLNKQARDANKIIPCKYAGIYSNRKNVGFISGNWSLTFGRVTQSHKIMDGTIRLHPEKSRRSIGVHPALFPVSLPNHIQNTWTDEDEFVYDPFSGLGTSIVAAEIGRRRCLAMELNSNYCAGTIERYHKHIEKTNAPSKPKRKVVT